MTPGATRRQGIGTRLVRAGRDGGKAAGCDWLHVDFDAALGDFYVHACAFERANTGLIRLA